MLRAIAAALFLLSASAAFAAPFPSISQDVGVCDPNNPSHCVAPDASGNMPVTGTLSASLGGFTPSASGARMTPLTVTVADSSGTLPTGAVTVVSNVGSNPMYCNVNGVAATTSDQLIASNSWFAFTIPNAITTLHCIATGGSTTANGVGGAGLATGAGGGAAGGGGGGSVTQGTTPWVDSITTWGGGTLGVMANYGTSPGAVLVPGVNAFITNTPAVSQSGAWTFQPGNTANTVPWLFTPNAGGNSAAVFSAGADATSNSTGQLVSGAFGYFYNGTTWDRARGDTTNGLWVNVKSSVLPTGASTSANQTSQLTQETATATVAGTTSDTAYAGSGNSTLSAALRGIYAILNTINTSVQGAIGAGTAYIGQVGLWSSLSNYVNGTTAAMTGTTSTQVIAAVTSKSIYVTEVSCGNSSSTGTFVNIQDGSGGTTLRTLTCGPTFGGHVEQAGGTPMFHTTSGNGLYAADATTGANVVVNASGWAQ